ncbi:MAG: hypothetical protein GWN84_26045, partial [Gammaproteobacteria bacterium]|nr:hypothetical protein [Gammaproteobacteria bacterium]
METPFPGLIAHPAHLKTGSGEFIVKPQRDGNTSRANHAPKPGAGDMFEQKSPQNTLQAGIQHLELVYHSIVRDI